MSLEGIRNIGSTICDAASEVKSRVVRLASNAHKNWKGLSTLQKVAFVSASALLGLVTVGAIVLGAKFLAAAAVTSITVVISAKLIQDGAIGVLALSNLALLSSLFSRKQLQK